MPEPEGIADAWWIRFGPLSLESTRRMFRRYRSGEGFAGDMEFIEAIELDAESSSMDRGRLEDSVIGDREEMEESSMLWRMGGVRLVEDEDREMGDELGYWWRAETTAPLDSEAWCTWGSIGAEEVR
jgi:hypothetical protein